MQRLRASLFSGTPGRQAAWAHPACLSTLAPTCRRREDFRRRRTAFDCGFLRRKTMGWELQQLRKSSRDRLLVGICGGLAEHTPVPAIAWRVAFVIATLCGGAGLLVYLLMWWLMPAADSTGARAGTAWNLQSLRRSTTDVQIAGVCGGLGEYSPIPAWLWRVAFIAAVFANLAGLLAYVLMWACVPRAEARFTST